MMRKTVISIFVALTIVSFIGPCWAVESMGVDIHGFISQGYLKTTDNNFIADSKDGTFEFNEIGINFSNKLSDRMRFSVQLFARDFGETDDSEIRIDFAYGDYFFKDWLGVRFGQLKAPHGLYNETRDIDMLRNSIFLPQSVYQEVVRSSTLSLQGVGLYGHLDMHAVGGLSYQAMYGTQTISQNSRMAEALVGYPSDLYDNENIDVDTKYAGNIVWATPLEGLRLGVSYDNVKMSLLGRWNTTLIPGLIEEGMATWMDYDKYENWVYSLEFTWRDLMLMGEYIQTNKVYEISFLGEDDSQPDGWYAGLTYRFADWFELGGYYSESHNNIEVVGILPELPDYYDYLKDVCVTTRFDINPYWVFKLEYHSFTGSQGLSARDNPESGFFTLDFFEKDWTMVAAKMTVSF